MVPSLNENPFDEPAFLEGLEAAGYLQRLDVSEARITARYQHALTKMQFAKHSEEFLTRAGVRRVHGSTVQFFNENPVSDPFVHVLVGSLPPARQALVTPLDLPTSGWTPIGSPDEADGTVHFTVSHAGFWPMTVVFDANPADAPGEDRYAPATDEEDDYYGRRPSRRGTGMSRSNSYYDGAASSYGRRARSASRSSAALRYGDDLDDDDATETYRSRRRRGSMSGSAYADDDGYNGRSSAYASRDGYTSGSANRRSSYASYSGRGGRGGALDDEDSADDYAAGGVSYSGDGYARSSASTGAARAARTASMRQSSMRSGTGRSNSYYNADY